MNTKEIKVAVRALPLDQRKQLGNRSTKYALRQWQTWVAFLVYFLVMIISHVIGDLLEFSTKPISVALWIGAGIGMPVFLCTFENQRRKSIVQALDGLQQENA